MKARTNFINVANDIGASDKAVNLGDDTYLAALGLYVLAVCYCDRQRTDGSIPLRAMTRVIAPGMDTSQLVAELVRVGFLCEDGDGWRVNGYLEWQRSAAEIEAAVEQRRKAGLASAKARAEKNEKNETNDKNDKSALSHPLNESPTSRPTSREKDWTEYDR